MYRTVPYIVLFLILALLQIFLFDNLSISVYLNPLVYIAFMFMVMRPFLRKIGDIYANSEVINKTFVGFIFLFLIIVLRLRFIRGDRLLFPAAAFVRYTGRPGGILFQTDFLRM